MLNKKVCYDCVQSKCGIQSGPWNKRDEGNWNAGFVFCPSDIDPMTENPTAKVNEPAPDYCPWKYDHEPKVKNDPKN